MNKKWPADQIVSGKCSLHRSWKKLSFLIILIILGSFTVSLLAQSNAYRLSENGTDPAEPRSRFDIILGEATKSTNGELFATTVSGDLAFARWGAVGAALPLMYANFANTGWALGDIQLNALLRLYRYQDEASWFQSLGAGADLFLNTGDADLGTGLGQYLVTPYLTATFFPARELMIAPLVEELITFGGDDKRKDRNELSIRIINVYTFPAGFWVNLTPELIVDLKGDTQNTWTLRNTLGKMTTKNLGFAADFITHIAGEKRFDYIARLNLRYLFD